MNSANEFDASTRFMLDTNAIDDIVGEKGHPNAVDYVRANGQRFMITSVQIDEIRRDEDQVRRERKLAFAAHLTEVPTADSVLEVTRLGSMRLSDGTHYDAIKGNRKFRPDDLLRSSADPLIASTALAEDAVLVTSDQHLAKAASGRLGVRVITTHDLIEFVRTCAA